MKGPKALLDAENNLVTDMGAWFPGERVVFRGKDLHHDLGDMSWVELYFFGVTGRILAEAQIKIITTIWAYTSFPEPRMWNNRVAALAANSRSTSALGLSAALAVSEASLYGRRLDARALDFFIKMGRLPSGLDELEGAIESYLYRYRYLPGFGRPVTNIDERIGPLKRVLRETGLHQGKHVLIVQQIERILKAKGLKLSANFGALTAAIAADMELTVQQYQLFAYFAFIGGMAPCFVDQSSKPEGTFFPLRCDAIVCRKTERRDWTNNGVECP